jgi:ankyrin repeat protein
MLHFYEGPDSVEQACRYGNLSVLKHLLSNGDINSNEERSKYKVPITYYNMIRWATMCGQLNIVKYIVPMTNLPKYSIRRECPISLAIDRGHLKILKYLMSIDVNLPKNINNILVHACRVGQTKIVEYLISCENKMGVQADIHFKDDWAIREACENGNLEIVKLLVSFGANIQYVNNRETFYRATENGFLNMIEYMVSNNSEVGNQLTIDDYNVALGIASDYGRLGIVEYLISIGADKYYDDHSAFYSAIGSGRLDIVKCFATGKNESGVPIDIHIDDDHAIQSASDCGHLEIVKYLVSLGADIHANDDYAYRVAIENDYPEIAEYLLSLDPTLAMIEHTPQDFTRPFLEFPDSDFSDEHESPDSYFNDEYESSD